MIAITDGIVHYTQHAKQAGKRTAHWARIWVGILRLARVRATCVFKAK